MTAGPGAALSVSHTASHFHVTGSLLAEQYAPTPALPVQQVVPTLCDVCRLQIILTKSSKGTYEIKPKLKFVVS